MDSEYLKKNVLPALTEALTAMASEVPEDQVEFVGRYLLTYVDRQAAAARQQKATKESEADLAQFHKEEEENLRKETEKLAPKRALQDKFDKFLHSLPSCATKQEGFKAACTFLETHMSIPAAYVAMCEREGEKEVLKYLVVGPNSANVLGKKLFKTDGEAEGEEGDPERLGVSFEAFKLPEVPEEEEAEPEEGEEPKPKKAPPTLSPLSVENVMRDKRVKFFGIPRLGAYLAIPATYVSIDHDAACVLKEREPVEAEADPEKEGDAAAAPVSNEPFWDLAPRENGFLLAMDTLGKYRLFEKEERSRAEAISKALVTLCETIDCSLAEEQLAFLSGDALKTLNQQVQDFSAKIGEAEATAVAAAAASLVPPAPTEGAEGGEGEAAAAAETVEAVDPAIAELLKVQKETAAAQVTWSETISRSGLGLALSSLSKCVLPLPAPALKLLLTIALLCNENATELEDVCGDPSWETIRTVFVPALTSKIANYSATASVTLASPRNAVASIKAFLETHGLADAGVYPTWLPVFGTVLLPWLQKAIAARDAAIAYSAEVDKVSLEN